MLVLLATPTPGIVTADYHDSVCGLLESPLPEVTVERVLIRGGPATAHQRNLACEHFLKTEADYLLFVDSDIRFDPNDLQILLDSKKYIVGARSYGFSQERSEPHPNWRPASDTPHEKGLIECSHIGMDFTLIQRNALEKLGVRPSEGWPYGHGIVEGRYTATEDILFCHRARESGLHVFVNAEARVYHFKPRLV